MDKIKFASKIFAIVVLVALMVAAILQLQEFATKPKDKYLQGQMEGMVMDWMEDCRIKPKLPLLTD